MVFDDVFQRFVEAAPACVMYRALMENIFAPQKLDAVFHKTAKKQYERELLFSTLVTLTSQVVCRISEKVRTAYLQPAPSKITVSLHRCLRQTAGGRVGDNARFGPTLGTRNERIDWTLQRFAKPLLPGYRVRILDGNHLGKTEHRLKVLRGTSAGVARSSVGASRPAANGDRRRRPLRGRACSRTEFVGSGAGRVEAARPADRRPQLLHVAVLVWHGGSQGSAIITAAWPDALEIAGKTALCWRCRVGTCVRRAGRIARSGNGTHDPGAADHPETQVADPRRRQRNLPVDQLADQSEPTKVASLYRKRWTLEQAFNELTTYLRCELSTLGYPKAALFAFCVAICCYNLLAAVKGTLRGVHGEKKSRKCQAFT